MRLPWGLSEFAEVMEGLSRDQFVSALKLAGFQPRAVANETALTIPDNLEYSFDTVSQYRLIKQLHGLRQQQGDTIENLAALCRAYARMSSLVEYHWSPMSKVFSARSLLYAQRLQAKFGKSCVVSANRAYVWALVGNCAFAEKELEVAREADSDPSTAPEWFSTVGAYCQFQTTWLGKVTGPHRRLALYFRMKALDPYYEEVRSLETIRELLLESPGCARAVHRMCELSGLMPHRQATEGATVPVWKAMYEQLEDIPGLPQEVSEIVTQENLRTRDRQEAANQKVRLNLIEALRNAMATTDGKAEPSWAVLGELFSNDVLDQAVQLLHTSRSKLGYPQTTINEIYESVLPGVKGHRFEKYLLSFTDNTAALGAGIGELYNSTNPAFFEMTTLPIAVAAHGAPGDTRRRLYDHLDNHWDKVQFDVQGAIQSQWDYWQNDAWPILIEICPNQPRSIAYQIRTTPDFNTAKGREWENRYSDNGYLMYELGMKYKGLKQSEDSIRCLKQSIENTPTHEAYFELADRYKERDDLDASIETLEASLEVPSISLEHGQANERIANILMSQARWGEALPYAREAAETYSAWGLLAAARCEEGMKNWKVSEAFYQAASQRYDNSADDWYWWCVRTGRGNLKAARQHLETIRSKYPSPLTWTQLWDRGGEQLLTNDIPAAIATFSTRGNYGYQDSRLMLLAAVLSERQRDLEKRDALYEVIRSTHDSADVVAELARLFRMSTKDPERFDWHEPVFLQIIDGANDEFVTFAYYCAGEFLANHNQEDRSLAYLQMAATARNQEEMSCCFAAMALRKLQQKIGDQRSSIGPDERARSVKLLKKSFYFSSHDKSHEAHALLTEAIATTPNFTIGLLYRGLLNEEGRDAEAIADYKACLEVDPDIEMANLNLAGLLASSNIDSLRNGPEALRCAQRAAELSEHPPGLHNRMIALAHAECGNFPEAIKFLEKAVKQVPENKKWADQLALIRSGKPYRRPVREPASQP